MRADYPALDHDMPVEGQRLSRSAPSVSVRTTICPAAVMARLFLDPDHRGAGLAGFLVLALRLRFPRLLGDRRSWPQAVKGVSDGSPEEVPRRAA